MADRKIGIGLLIIVLVLFAETFTFPMRPHIILNTDFWPRVLLALLGGISCFLIWKGNLDGLNVVPMHIKAFSVVGFCILYVLLLELIGFIILTPIFIFVGSITLSKKRNIPRMIEAGVVALVGSAATFFIFQEGLLVQLPEGLLH
jgi:putative tricarboxylic transport membrane protein